MTNINYCQKTKTIKIRDMQEHHYLYQLTNSIICICTWNGRGLNRKGMVLKLDLGASTWKLQVDNDKLFTEQPQN